MQRIHWSGIIFLTAASLAIFVPTPAFAQSNWSPTAESAQSTWSAGPASAQPNWRIEKTKFEKTQSEALKWEIAYQVLNAVDAAQTIYVIETGRGVEANPLFGKKPKPFVIIAAKASWGVVHFLTVSQITKKNPKLGLRVAQISVIGQGAVVGLNARFVF